MSGTGSGGTTPTTDASLASALSATRTVLVLAGGILASNGYGKSEAYNIVELVAGSIMVVGPLLWGMYTAWTNLIDSRRKQAQAVQAGINLTIQQKAVTDAGTVITTLGTGPGTTPPKQVTSITAPEIVKNFGPSVAEVKETDALNAAQLGVKP